MLVELKDHRGAVEAFQKVIDLNPNHADAYYQMGLAHAEALERPSGGSGGLYRSE